MRAKEDAMGTMAPPAVATREEWQARRLALLAREKELSRLRDEIALGPG